MSMKERSQGARSCSCGHDDTKATRDPPPVRLPCRSHVFRKMLSCSRQRHQTKPSGHIASRAFLATDFCGLPGTHQRQRKIPRFTTYLKADEDVVLSSQELRIGSHNGVPAGVAATQMNLAIRITSTPVEHEINTPSAKWYVG